MIHNIRKSAASYKQWDKADGHSTLAIFAQSIYPVSKGLIDYVNANSFVVKINRGKHIVKAGEICQHIYFIKKGVIRAYIKEGSKEICTWITAENEIVTSIRGFHLQLPSIENIQAIEDCELVAADYTSLQYLYDNFMEMNIVGRKLLQQYYIDAEERAYICRLANASLKYKYFMETKSELANRIPLKLIASYLGMTLETLSRMRGKLLQPA